MRIHYLIRFDILSLPNDEEEKDRLDLVSSAIASLRLYSRFVLTFPLLHHMFV